MRYILICIFFVVLIGVKSPILYADDQCTENLAGINLAGAEFGQVPGREWYDYHFPSNVQIMYFAKVGFNSIRLPILWERLQPVLNGPLDRHYLSGITSILDSAAENGVTVLIDLHNYSHYRGEILGSDAVPATAFFDVWQKIASTLKTYKALYAYGLMNEPYHDKGLWLQVAQSGVDGIRSVDSFHRIYVAEADLNLKEPDPLSFVKDPMNLIVYEGHFYFDANHTGMYNSIVPTKDPRILVEEGVIPFIKLLTKYGKKGVIGEWGVPNNDERWFPAVDRMIEISRVNCIPTYYWAGGNWSPGYKLSLRPVDGDGEERLLTKHFSLILGADKK